MKELHIIIKTPDTGNPLDQEVGREPHEGASSVGWKFLTERGEWYGDYILLDKPDAEEILESIELLLRQAYETAKALLEGGDYGSKV